MAPPPRFHCPVPLSEGATLALPPGAARHVQVLRLQPGAPVTLFGGLTAGGASAGGEFSATVIGMGRSSVDVRVGPHQHVEREPLRLVHLAVGMPANERMDWMVEKATELGAAGIQPLMTERTVVRLDTERARKKTEHWRSIAVAACEQCGRNRVPRLSEAQTLRDWLAQTGPPGATSGPRLMLSLRDGARALQTLLARDLPADAHVTLLCGPEGGLSHGEEQLASDHGFQPVTLGPRVLRSETAALAALTLLA